MKTLLIAIISFCIFLFHVISVQTASATVPLYEITITGGSNTKNCNSCIVPQNITVSRGTAIEWINKDLVPHDIVSGKPGDPDNGTIFDTGSISMGKFVIQDFDNIGVFPYFDKKYPWNTGTVTVIDQTQWNAFDAVGDLSANGIITENQVFCNQHFDHGPTLAETIGKVQCENPITQVNYKGANLTVINVINKTTFRMGENITVIPELTNAGNHNVTIGYCGQLFVTLTIDQSGKIVSPQYSWACPLFSHGITLEPNASTPGESYGQFIALHTPGNYTIRSIASFADPNNPIVLWSAPTQITILPEKVPEFPLTIPILLISITSLIVFYRTKFGK